TAGAAADATTDAQGGHPSGSICIDPVPPGWLGPVILSDQTGGPPTPVPPACPASYPSVAFDGHVSPTAPDADCRCSCGSLWGVLCRRAREVGFGADGPWVGPGSGGPRFSALGVSPGSAGRGGGGAMAPGRETAAGSCQPQPTSNSPPIEWAETARACQTSAV